MRRDEMTKDEIRMTNQTAMTNDKIQVSIETADPKLACRREGPKPARRADFKFVVSSFIRPSDFVLRHSSMSGQREEL